MLALAEQPLEITDQFEATLVWMHDEPGHMGRAYELKLANQWASASLTSMKYRVNVNTQAHESCKQLAPERHCRGQFGLEQTLGVCPLRRQPHAGRLHSGGQVHHATVAAGMIRHNLRRAQNVPSRR